MKSGSYKNSDCSDLMSGEEINICPECGKNIADKKGSITQWIGLGDSCKCALEDLAVTSSQNRKKNKTKICKRCLKRVGSSQSMTQWLIRKEICKCAKESESRPATNYAQKAVSKHGLHQAQRHEEKQTPVGVMSAGVVLFILVCTFAASEALGVTQVLNAILPYQKSDEVSFVFLNHGKQVATVPMPQCKDDWETPAILTADELRLKDISISDKELRFVSINSQVNTIVLQCCDGFTYSGIQALMNNSCLYSFSLEGSRINRFILQTLGYGQMRILDLSHTNIADEDWSVLLHNKHLNTLKIYGVKISDANRKAFNNARFSTNSECFVRQ